MDDWEEYEVPVEEGGEKEDEFVPVRDNLLLVVDARAEAVESGRLRHGLECALTVMKTKLRVSGGYDRVGVVLAGTRAARNPHEFAGVFLVSPLAPPSGRDVRRVRALAEEVTQSGVRRPEAEEAGEDGAGWANIGSAPAGAALPVDLALWVCQSLFAEARGPARGRSARKVEEACQVWFFTGDARPMEDDVGVVASVRRAEQLRTVGAELFVFAQEAKEHFPQGPFWAPLLSPWEEPDDDGGDAEGGLAAGALASSLIEFVPPLAAPATDAASASSRASVGAETTLSSLGGWETSPWVEALERRSFRKRTYARIPLTLGPGLHAGVGLYHLTVPAKPPSAVLVEGERSRPVQSRRHYVREGTGDPVPARDVTTGVVTGAGVAPLSRMEAAQCRWVPPPPHAHDADADASLQGRFPGLRLLGTMPLALLPRDGLLRPSLFIYPDEASVRHSATLVRALITSLERKGLVAIALLVARTGAAPSLMALLPQRSGLADEDGADGFPDPPPGLFGLFLPWADDVRELPTHAVQASFAAAAASNPSEAKSSAIAGLSAADASSAVAAADRLIARAQLTRSAGPGTLENPSLSLYYSMAEALVLRDSAMSLEDLLAHHKDATLPAPQLRDRTAAPAADLLALVGAMQKTKPKPRAKAAATKATAAKKATTAKKAPARRKAKAADSEDEDEGRVSGRKRGARVSDDEDDYEPPAKPARSSASARAPRPSRKRSKPAAMTQ